MFSIFKPKSEEQKLQKKYDSLMNEWHKLLNVNRKESDKKFAEAQDVLSQIESLNSK